MAKKIDLSLIGKIEEKLNSQKEWQSEINCHELVGLVFSAIDKAVKEKATWTAIAQSIQDLIGESEKINPNTLRQYYFYFKSHPEALPKKKRKVGKSKENQKSTTEEALESTIVLTASDCSERRSTPTVQALAQTVDAQVKSGEETTEIQALLPEPRKKTGSNFAY
ncbi:hypothetical protein H6G89_31995 [Oscillatoria sp. FACHB-1407]|uniref:hypothetical protein n=1 Tax=Oscillatoria sp. FACHB-1407 TaxID=2692847 RepID=UPI001688FEFA|nr:hypothetical protein [Oscillatoria sp. FACHB-1407]MBD2465616.1 hypothetical protein [Oscillatoria sp. FACHB-1407]